jgi:hypothetical protein
MGIEVPETCFAYHKCSKAYSDIYLVFLLYAYATMHGQTHINFKLGRFISSFSLETYIKLYLFVEKNLTIYILFKYPHFCYLEDLFNCLYIFYLRLLSVCISSSQIPASYMYFTYIISSSSYKLYYWYFSVKNDVEACAS